MTYALEVPCPQCGQLGRCYHRGNVSTGEEYHDLYEFECQSPQCGWKGSQTVFAGTISGANWYTRCPFCRLPGH